jgi:hypothetical protein
VTRQRVNPVVDPIPNPDPPQREDTIPTASDAPLGVGEDEERIGEDGEQIDDDVDANEFIVRDAPEGIRPFPESLEDDLTEPARI